MAGTLDELTILPDGSFAVYVRPSTYIETKTLAAGVAEAVAVPAGAVYVVFGADCNFGVRYNATAAGTAASLADTADGSGCEVNPTIRALRGVAELSLISTAGGAVSMAFFK